MIPWWLAPFCLNLIVCLAALWTSTQKSLMAPELMAAIVFMMGTLITIPVWAFFFIYSLLT